MWQGAGWQQWPIQQAMYQNVPHDQVDWAALAKQWIDMQRVGGPDGTTGPPQPFPMPPPGAGSFPPSAGTPPPQIVPAQPVPIIETFQPKIVPSVRNEILPIPVVRPTASPLNITKPSDFPIVNAEPVPVTSWNNSWEAPPAGSNWNAPQVISETKPAAAFSFGNSMHGNLPLQAQSYDYNHGSDPFVSQQNLNFNSNDGPYPQYWTTSGSESLPPFLRKDNRIRGDENLSMNSDDFNQMCNLDAAKRKQLPIWIREGLEKMERDRQRQQEKERLKREYEERRAQQALASAQDHLKDDDPLKKSRFESESEDEREETIESKANSLKLPQSPANIKVEPLTEEEKMLKMRRMLTEILLEVTNEELVQVAKEVYQRALAKAPARQLASSTALASITGGLGGLSGYGSGGSNNESEIDESSDEEDEEDSDDELRRIIAEKKNSFVIKEMEIEALLQAEEKALKETQSNVVVEEENAPNNASNANEKNIKIEIDEIKTTTITRSSSSATDSSSDSQSSETSGARNNIEKNITEKIMSRRSRTKSRSTSIDSNRGCKTKDSFKNKPAVLSRERTTTKDSKKSRRSRSESRSRRGSRNRTRRSSSRNRNGGRIRSSRKSRSRSRNRRSRTSSRGRNRPRSRTRRRDSRSRSRNRRSSSRNRRNHSRDRKSRDAKTRSRHSRSRNRSAEKTRSDKKRLSSREPNSRSKDKNKRSRSKSQERNKSTTIKKGLKERDRSRSISPNKSKNRKKARRNSNSDSSDSSPHSGKKSS